MTEHRTVALVALALTFTSACGDSRPPPAHQGDPTDSMAGSEQPDSRDADSSSRSPAQEPAPLGEPQAPAGIFASAHLPGSDSQRHLVVSIEDVDGEAQVKGCISTRPNLCGAEVTLRLSAIDRQLLNELITALSRARPCLGEEASAYARHFIVQEVTSDGEHTYRGHWSSDASRWEIDMRSHRCHAPARLLRFLATRIQALQERVYPSN